MRIWLNEQIKETVQQNMEFVGFTRGQLTTDEAYSRGASPFYREIKDHVLPEKFSVLRFNLYDGTLDPEAHLQHFTQRMLVWGNEGGLNCKVFFSSLGDLPLQWFCALSEESILSWRQLLNTFVEKFQAHRVIPKTNDNLMAIRMRPSENITRFAKRFWTINSQVEGANDEVAIKSFKQALLLGDELRKDLARFRMVTMKALMTRVNWFIEQEEDEV